MEGRIGGVSVSPLWSGLYAHACRQCARLSSVCTCRRCARTDSMVHNPSVLLSAVVSFRRVF